MNMQRHEPSNFDHHNTVTRKIFKAVRMRMSCEISTIETGRSNRK